MAVVLTGIGAALIIVGIPNVIVEIVPAHDTSEAVGIIYSVGRHAFAAIGTSIVGILLSSSMVPGTTAPTLSAWNLTTVFVIVMAILGLIATAMIAKAKPMAERGTVVEAIVEGQEDELAVRPSRRTDVAHCEHVRVGSGIGTDPYCRRASAVEWFGERSRATLRMGARSSARSRSTRHARYVSPRGNSTGRGRMTTPSPNR